MRSGAPPRRGRHFPDNIVAIRCANEVRKADYEAVVIPAVLGAPKHHAELRFHYEVDETSDIDPARRGKISGLVLRICPAGTTYYAH